MGSHEDDRAAPAQAGRNSLFFASTGIPHLDEVLGGGLPPGALTLLVGPPGSGKTTLATQIAFATARAGQNALILTALSEPTTKLIAHLQAFAFFDRDLLGTSVQILSLEQFFEHDLETTAEELTKLVRTHSARMVVIDGIQGIPGVERNVAAARAFLYRLGTTLSLFGTTTVITREAEPHDPLLFPEATTTDVIVGLHYSLVGVRERRGIEAVKVRGIAHLPGMHSLVLGSDGLEVYPRLEARVQALLRTSNRTIITSRSVPAQAAEERAHEHTSAAFGVPAFDALFGGGITPTTSTVIAGATGTGKTTMALHFALEGVRRKEPVVWLSFRESRAQLLLKSLLFGGQLLERALVPDGTLTLLEAPPVELLADQLGDQLLSTIDQVAARRLVVDSLGELVRVVSGLGDTARVEEYLTALLIALRLRGVTSIFLNETAVPAAGDDAYSIGQHLILSENLLVLQEGPDGDRLQRSVSVRKLRFSAHETIPHTFRIGADVQGLQLLSPSDPVSATEARARETAAHDPK